MLWDGLHRRVYHTALLFAGTMLLATALAGHAGTIRTPYAQKAPLHLDGIELSSPTVGQYQKVELRLKLSATYDNPFDPADIAVNAKCEMPSGRSVVVPGFFYQDYRRELRDGAEHLEPAGPPEWRVRLTGWEIGLHRVTVSVRDRSGFVRSDPVVFRVKPSSSAGFVRVSREDGRYFALDDGAPYFPVGANTCWASGRGTFDYDVWFPSYQKAGCNYGRLWLSPHWSTFALERAGKPEQGRGLGQFDLANAWRLDYVLQQAERSGLRLMLCIDSYNILRVKGGWPQWENSPHNARHGGPLKTPAEFWTHPEMNRFYMHKLRYLVARYGYSPHVLAWEFWNEADLTTGYRSDVARAWHERMARTLRRLDPFEHLITTSFARTPGDPVIDRLPEIDYVQTHHYGSPDLARTIAEAQRQKAAYGKPQYVGEIGADSRGPRCDDDPQGLQIHDPLWVSIVTGGAGAAQPWWWDNCIHPRNLYGVFTPLARFVTGIDWPRENFKPIPAEVQWQENKPRSRVDLVLTDGPVSWQPSEFNRPRIVRVTKQGLSGDIPVAGIQHGVVNHPALHNPVTFDMDLPWPTTFVVEVGDVSGHGGAALRVTLDGRVVLDKDFADPDGLRDRGNLRQYAGPYSVVVPSGRHRLVVENPGRDWFYCRYRFTRAYEPSKPPLLAWALAGDRTAMAWVRIEGRSWRRVCQEREKFEPVPPSLLKLPDLTPGTWKVELWDTWTGNVLSQNQLIVSSEAPALVALPVIDKDLAIKLRRGP